jgi:hypothetical protein
MIVQPPPTRARLKKSFQESVTEITIYVGAARQVPEPELTGGDSSCDRVPQSRTARREARGCMLAEDA